MCALTAKKPPTHPIQISYPTAAYWAEKEHLFPAVPIALLGKLDRNAFIVAFRKQTADISENKRVN